MEGKTSIQFSFQTLLVLLHNNLLTIKEDVTTPTQFEIDANSQTEKCYHSKLAYGYTFILL